MTPDIISRILRSCYYEDGQPLNILTTPTHERYESLLARTGHNFYALQGWNLKEWDSRYAKVPDNYTILDGDKQLPQIPPDVIIDVVLCQNRPLQHTILQSYAQTHNIPMVYLEHVLPNPKWGMGTLNDMRSRRGQGNVFISDYSRQAWGFEGEDTFVIEHAIDTEVFTDQKYSRYPVALSVVNKWKQRDFECGYTLWTEIIKDLPYRVLGDNPGLSDTAKTLEELVFAYQTSRIFVNTSLVSPVPTTLLEAMACGCAVVTTKNPMIADIIQDGENGYVVDPNDKSLLRQRIFELLEDEDRCAAMGTKARETIINRFSVDRFLSEWNRVFHYVRDKIV